MTDITVDEPFDDNTPHLQKINSLQKKIEEIKAKETDLLLSIKNDPGKTAYTDLTLANEMLNLALCCIEIDTISRTYLKRKNEQNLNEGRKAVIKSLQYLENVVTDLVDAPFSYYEEKLAEIESFDASRRYHFVEKIGKTIGSLKEACKEITKWKWSFVELDGRYAAVAKNILDLKKAVLNSDPRSPHYESTIYHLRMVKELLGFAADRYRERYEISTNDKDDFQKGINFLSALYRIHTLTGERDDAVTVKKKMEAWTSKLKTDIKSKKTRVA